jgi:hypothetical protein
MKGEGIKKEAMCLDVVTAHRLWESRMIRL